MTDTSRDKAKVHKPHTELRRQDKVKPDGEEAATRLKPRTPADRIPAEGDEDDLFNDMPV